MSEHTKDCFFQQIGDNLNENQNINEADVFDISPDGFFVDFTGIQDAELCLTTFKDGVEIDYFEPDTNIFNVKIANINLIMTKRQTQGFQQYLQYLLSGLLKTE